MLFLLFLQTMFPSWKLFAKKKTPLQQPSQKSTKYDWSGKWKLNLYADKSKCGQHFSIWPNDSKWHPLLNTGGRLIRVNDTPRLLEAFCSMLISNMPIYIIKTLSYHNYSTYFLRLVETFITNCFPRLRQPQARLPHSTMATLVFQHQHHQFGSSPKSVSTFDNWATSLYSTQSLETDLPS